MPNQVIEYRCLLISPNDVLEERDALTEVVARWNAQVGKGLNARVELVRWEYHSAPDLSMPAQETLNEQIVNECDLGIAVFWSKLGSPTGRHASGSVEEITKLLEKGARVMVYFCSRDIPQHALHDDQYPKLIELKKQFQQEGLYTEYDTSARLREQVNLNLTNVISTMLAKDRGTNTFVPTSGTLVAPTPEVKVTVNPGFMKSMGPFYEEAQDVLMVEVQNHSPVTVYISNVSLQMKSGKRLTVMQDFATGAFQARRELHSGESFSFTFDPWKLAQDANEITGAVVTDAIGRVYRSESQRIGEMIRLMIERKK